MTIHIFILVITAYLLGSIPSAVWIGKCLHGIDVREHGSCNAGATNTMRVLGVKTGIPVLLIDIAKGFAAVGLAVWTGWLPESDMRSLIQLVLGVCAVTGHVFPLFAGFRGGKGVATVVGVLLALHWPATLVAVGIFLLSLVLTHYVSISSMLMGCSFPVSVIWLFRSYQPVGLPLQLFSLAVAALLIVTHRKNIRRLIKGEEGKATFLFKNHS